MLRLMIFKDISLDEISLENEAFKISEELDSAPVRDSLRQVGQLNPVILLDQKPQMAIVCGFRRIHALKQIGSHQAFARVLSDKDFDAARAFELALWDNLSHRQLDPLEKARVLFKLKNMCGTPNDRLVRVYLPLLGLAPNANVMDNYILLNGIHHNLRQCLIEGRLTHASLECLAELPTQIQEYMASLMSRIRLSASLQKKILNLLDDLASMTGGPFDAPLKSPQVMAILEDAGLSPFQKGEKVHGSLYRLKNPRHSQAVDRFLAQKKLLKLPGSIQINARPFFEEPGLHIEFDASSIDRFRQLAAALQDAAQSPELEGLFRLD
jgi:ParB-like nuclease domain